jgi:hypothetical protein
MIVQRRTARDVLLFGLGCAPLFRRIRIEVLGRRSIVSNLLSVHKFLLSELFLNHGQVVGGAMMMRMQRRSEVDQP